MLPPLPLPTMVATAARRAALVVMLVPLLPLPTMVATAARRAALVVMLVPLLPLLTMLTMVATAARRAALVSLADDLKRLSVLYDLYAEQKAFAESQSNMLWTNLDTRELSHGAQDLTRKLAALDKSLRELPTYKAVAGTIEGFKASIPLIASLKNDAMQPRHWEKLMKTTGVVFNMNPKTFTLQRLFEMNLDQHQETIDEITAEAMQEAKIERQIADIESHWGSTNFEVMEYHKNGQFRSYVLRVEEDMKTTLEDHMLQLQTMASSRFVGFFAARVQQWSRNLTTVSEVSEMWGVVQQKWQYLEGIFVGNEDIKSQLPDEVRRFAGIDKAFKTLMGQRQQPSRPCVSHLSPRPTRIKCRPTSCATAPAENGR
jgi:dynein heavy chain